MGSGKLVRDDLQRLLNSLKKHYVDCHQDKRDAGAAVEILEQLAELKGIDKYLLKDSGCGRVVGKLRKDKDTNVAALAKSIVEQWKQHLENTASSGDMKADIKAEKQDYTPSASPARNSFDGVEKSFSKADFITGITMRDKVRNLIAEAVNTFGDFKSDLEALFVASQIEDVMIRRYGDTNAEYKAKFRELAFNLKDAKNTELNKRVADGEIQPHELVSMAVKDMASDALKSKRAEMQQYNKDAHRSDWNREMGATDMFKCGKCKKRKTVYYQMQTRSADEPMTTFVTCLHCNNRWRC